MKNINPGTVLKSIYVSVIRFFAFEEYANEINSSSTSYDFIIIDGRARNDCLQAAKSRLAKAELILFDNILRKRYGDAIAASSGGIRQFSGRVPSLPYSDDTCPNFFPRSHP